MDNRLNEKSYAKSKTVRKLHRDQMFERNRHLNVSSYLDSYDERTQTLIKQSLEGPLPYSISQLKTISRETISYFRRCLKPVYKTKMQHEVDHDLHMTFESLWGLAATENIEVYDNYQKVIKQFQENLSLFLSLSGEIKEMAIIAAGNKVLGKEEDVISIAKEDENQLWVLINHIYQRKIPFTAMYNFLSYSLPIVYKTIYEMSNNLKDEIIESIIRNEQVLQKIFDGMFAPNPEVSLYCVRIIGNILAERDDFSEIFMKYQILDRVSVLLHNQSISVQGEDASLRSNRQTMRKDIFWLLSNYICDASSANYVLNHEDLRKKILAHYRSESNLATRTEIYYTISYLMYYGDRYRIYKLALSENILAQCSHDIEVENQQLTLLILHMIEKLVEIGEEYETDDDDQMADRNPFTSAIVNSRLKTYIHAKTYNKNVEISNISFQIMDHIQEFEQKYENS